jgi:hypothetical protein
MDDPSKQLPFYQQPWFKIGAPVVFVLGVYGGLYWFWPPANFVPIVIDVVTFGMAFVITLILASQYVLPVRTIKERSEAASRMFDYVSGGHGPIVFVRDGQVLGNVEELKRKGEGVILLDGFSAVLLERGGRYARAAGPGIVYTKKGETVAATFDLRKQSRSQQTQVLTKDGIEIKVNVSATFLIDPTPSSKPQEDAKKEEKDFLSDAKITPASQFNASSAFKAHYGFAVIDKDTQVKWLDLPMLVATEIARDFISKETFDDLFFPRITQDTSEASAPPPQPKMGVVQSRFASEVQNTRLLKERGIKIESASMSVVELPEAVIDQRRKSWAVKWQQEAVKHIGASDVAIERIKEVARVEAQREIFDHIRRNRDLILNPNSDSKSKAAIAKVFVERLQYLVSDPTTQMLLPRDTLKQLTNLRYWVNVSETSTEGEPSTKPSQTEIAPPPSEDISEITYTHQEDDAEDVQQ